MLTTIGRRLSGALLVAALCVSVAAAQSPNDEAIEPDPDDDYGQLVVAPGVVETYGYCTPCHSEMIVAQQGLSRERWAKLFDWMVEEQGMGEIVEPDLSIILDYLATNYNTDRPNFPRN